MTQGTNLVSFDYDAANRRTSLTLPNGIVTTYGYDTASQLTSLTYTLGATTLGDLTYTYDGGGQRRTVGGSWARTNLPAAVTSATYDAANQIATFGGASFTYDANGSLTSDGTTTYTWNARNQLSGLSGGSSASFLYDGVHRRRSKTISGTTTGFLYDGLNFVQEQGSVGTPTMNLLTGLSVDETFTRTDASATNIRLTDGMGSLLELADSSGSLQTHFAFDPFGATSVSGVTTSDTQQFAGREADGTGLYYNRARYYKPSTGRFISEDPTAADEAFSLYNYARSNPLRYTDPTGLQAHCVLASTTNWVSAGSLLHRFQTFHTSQWFNLLWFDATCPECKTPTNPVVVPTMGAGVPSMGAVYSLANPQIEFTEKISKNHVRYGVSIQTRIATFVAPASFENLIMVCYDCK